MKRQTSAVSASFAPHNATASPGTRRKDVPGSATDLRGLGGGNTARKNWQLRSTRRVVSTKARLHALNTTRQDSADGVRTLLLCRRGVASRKCGEKGDRRKSEEGDRKERRAPDRRNSRACEKRAQQRRREGRGSGRENLGTTGVNRCLHNEEPTRK
uniref:Uncharacterized protein n=1 Tax=Toxoplasma gondii COUG TaxID=1074873 RepID=A0A2G8Y4T8_TOXGO|nr:hypothetical protein TGCOUG_266290 [Toxoplasma gondii COUG]